MRRNAAVIPGLAMDLGGNYEYLKTVSMASRGAVNRQGTDRVVFQESGSWENDSPGCVPPLNLTVRVNAANGDGIWKWEDKIGDKVGYGMTAASLGGSLELPTGHGRGTS